MNNILLRESQWAFGLSNMEETMKRLDRGLSADC